MCDRKKSSWPHSLINTFLEKKIDYCFRIASRKSMQLLSVQKIQSFDCFNVDNEWNHFTQISCTTKQIWYRSFRLTTAVMMRQSSLNLVKNSLGRGYCKLWTLGEDLTAYIRLWLPQARHVTQLKFLGLTMRLTAPGSGCDLNNYLWR